jgi:hypothetical protein
MTRNAATEEVRPADFEAEDIAAAAADSIAVEAAAVEVSTDVEAHSAA